MAETATTAAVTVFPTTNDVVGGSGYTAAGSGKTLGEALLNVALTSPFEGKSYVKSGGAYQLVSGRTFRHTSAWCNINGYIVRTAATPETLTCEASSTCYTWLQLVRNASSQVTGARWLVTTTASLPTLPTNGVTGDQVLFGYTTANASAMTAQGDTYRGIITPGGIVKAPALLTSTWTSGALAASASSATIHSMSSVIHDGLTDILFDVNIDYLASAAFPFYFALFDSATGAAIGKASQQPPAASARSNCIVNGRLVAAISAIGIAPRNVNMAVVNYSAGGITVQGDATSIAAAVPTILTARWGA